MTNNNQEIKLSIVIPHFDSVETLKRLLISIHKECNDKVETIVIDDNSTKEVELFEKIKEKFDQNTKFLINDTKKNSAGKEIKELLIKDICIKL